MLPLGLRLTPGVRMLIDYEQPVARPYVLCVANGCMADFDVNADFIGRLMPHQRSAVPPLSICRPMMAIAC